MQQRFNSHQKMSDLINQDHSLLLVIARFGLHLGFGNKSVFEVCSENGIDTDTFLAVVNFLADENVAIENTFENINIETVVNYLSNAHTYFLNFKLPSLRQKLYDAVYQPEENTPYVLLFMRFFDEYESEVRNHMEYENNTVFKYAKQLSCGELIPDYSIAVFQKKHHQIDSKLEELKNILIKYFPDKGSNYLLTEVLFDILSCEVDIISHNKVEDFLFIPAIKTLEKKLTSKNARN